MLYTIMEEYLDGTIDRMLMERHMARSYDEPRPYKGKYEKAV